MADVEHPSENVVPIAEVVASTGLSADALRYYERSGLLPAIARTTGGQRRYTPRDLERITLSRTGSDGGSHRTGG
ncbi:MerR family transcriptional regulator [uncultured Pseudokineococcus sp.]|uniref:MerR family transcriptional regulator n=1 Tax=uncultured Pseudokineococcus sp. TaxID=1642928 RepID=UPI0026092452|nr:MerR family transcriptional regulator [uncultured Pseudokineococcus sp.]